MSGDNKPFEDLRAILGDAIERLESTGGELSELRASLHALDGGIGRYCDIFYPMPYKRPDGEVLDIVTEAVHAIDTLTQKLK